VFCFHSRFSFQNNNTREKLNNSASMTSASRSVNLNKFSAASMRPSAGDSLCNTNVLSLVSNSNTVTGQQASVSSLH
jgi:hypothetical protein